MNPDALPRGPLLRRLHLLMLPAHSASALQPVSDDVANFVSVEAHGTELYVASTDAAFGLNKLVVRRYG